jgi:hypothetical protein
MPVSPKWKDVRKTTIVITYQSPWTWDEFHEAAQATNALMDTVDHDVVLIHDTSHGGILPSGNIVAHGVSAISNFSDNLALIVVVVNSTLIRTFLSIVISMNPAGRGDKIKTVPTLEKAYLMADEILQNI